MSALSFRPMLPGDLAELAELFVEAIEVLAEEDYSDAARAAWAARAEDLDAFGAILSGGVTILAESRGEIAGFATLKGDQHIEMLYVSPEHARRGVGKALVGVLELLAAKRGSAALTVESSDTAKPLFEALGYVIQARNTVLIDGEWLANSTMKKALAAPAQQAAGNA